MGSFSGKIRNIDDVLFKRMCFSWAENNPVPLQDLRYLELSHWNFSGLIQQGELIVHHLIAKECLEIFHELFDLKFPIHKMRLIDEYKADDLLSMQDNNTSGFCSRKITGKPAVFSHHSYGLAIDINPLYNPYIKNDKLILPESGKKYLDRQEDRPGMLTGSDHCCQVFKARSWYWGGEWQDPTCKDYQHFCKAPRAWQGDFSILSF